MADAIGELEDLYLDREMAKAKKLQVLPAEAVGYGFDAEVQRPKQRLYDLGVRDVSPDESCEITKDDPMPIYGSAALYRLCEMVYPEIYVYI